MTIWRMLIAFWVPKATNTRVRQNLPLFYYKNVCTNAPQFYVIRTLLFLFLHKSERALLSLSLSLSLSIYIYILNTTLTKE